MSKEIEWILLTKHSFKKSQRTDHITVGHKAKNSICICCMIHKSSTEVLPILTVSFKVYCLVFKVPPDDSMCPPEFTQKLMDRKINDGEPLELTCFIKGDPDPQVTWLKDGKVSSTLISIAELKSSVSNFCNDNLGHFRAISSWKLWNLDPSIDVNSNYSSFLELFCNILMKHFN